VRWGSCGKVHVLGRLFTFKTRTMKNAMIVSSKALAGALSVALVDGFEEEAGVAFKADGSFVVVGTTVVTGEKQAGWQDFELERPQAQKLFRILFAMAEQPLTIRYDGSWIRIGEVLV
jgi:hypothetical protein